MTLKFKDEQEMLEFLKTSKAAGSQPQQEHVNLNELLNDPQPDAPAQPKTAFTPRKYAETQEIYNELLNDFEGDEAALRTYLDNLDTLPEETYKSEEEEFDSPEYQTYLKRIDDEYEKQPTFGDVILSAIASGSIVSFGIWYTLCWISSEGSMDFSQYPLSHSTWVFAALSIIVSSILTFGAVFSTPSRQSTNKSLGGWINEHPITATFVALSALNVYNGLKKK